MFSSLEEFESDKNVIICKPDKGTGTVILNKSDYITKMELILKGKINFKINTNDLYKIIIKFAEENNRLIEQLFKSEAICDVDRKKIDERKPLGFGLGHRPVLARVRIRD